MDWCYFRILAIRLWNRYFRDSNSWKYRCLLSIVEQLMHTMKQWPWRYSSLNKDTVSLFFLFEYGNVFASSQVEE